MSTAPKNVDRILLGIVLALVAAGFFIFSSASLGLLARGEVSFSSVAFNQIILGIGGGFFMMFLLSRIHYRTWRKYAFFIFIAGLLLSAAVFIPGLGFEHGGARRWLLLGSFSLQPSEFLKIAFVIYIATWLSGYTAGSRDVVAKYAPLVAIVLVAIVILLQRDTDTFLIMGAVGAIMYFVKTGRWKVLLSAALIGVLLIAVLAIVRPYVKERISAFVDPESDPRGSGYQISQSMIAVGSGGIAGRGFGQSIQKFGYLPEATGDSIFAVFAEEFGFIGVTILILLFSGFALRGYRLATKAKDEFGTLLVVGIISIISIQAFLHIAAMIHLAPILGLPLPFISHGGTAMLATLAMVGIVLNVSKYQKR